MSIFGTTDTPVSAFWWRLLWVSKPECVALVMLGRGVRDVRDFSTLAKAQSMRKKSFLKLIFRWEPYFVRYGNIVYIRFIKFK